MKCRRRYRFVAFAAFALASCVLTTACSRGSEHEDLSWDAASAKRISVNFGQGACADTAECDRRCDAGEADQCRRIGDTLLFAPDGGEDDARATAYYAHACELGNAPACLSAGHMNEYHRGVHKDDTKAADYYRHGCDKGHVPSCTNYAIMIENGRGVDKDVASAIRLYREACSAGVGLACDRLRALSVDAGSVARPP